LNDIIGKNFNILEKRILLVIEAWKKNKKEKDNLRKELSICKEKIEIKLKEEQEHLKKRIDFLKREREEIKSRIKKLLEAISFEDSTSYQPDNIE
jgi:chromosome segregation ATPase